MGSEKVVSPLARGCLAAVYLARASPESSGKLHLSSWNDQKWIHFSKPWAYRSGGIFPPLVKEILVGPVSGRPILEIDKARRIV